MLPLQIAKESMLLDKNVIFYLSINNFSKLSKLCVVWNSANDSKISNFKSFRSRCQKNYACDHILSS